MFKLVICDDEGKTTVVPLVRDEVTIGRREGNTIRLTERNVSRRHARLRKSDGAFLVEDLRSYNGVRVNGRRIEEETTVNAGDQIAIGDYVIALQADQVGIHLMDPSEPTERMPPMVPEDTEMHGATTAVLPMPPTSVPPARLVMMTPPAPGAEFALVGPLLRVGRAEDLDVWVNHRSISREHAEIRQEGDEFIIRDLGSANGVCVNGEELTESALRSGDVIELGQVRFRFVGPGETYTFEGDRTIQMDAASFPLPRRSLAIWGGAAAIIVILLTVFVATSGFGAWGKSPSSVALAGESGPDDTPEPTAVAAPGRSAVAEALRNCVTALADERYAEAISYGAAALQLQPDHAEARSCMRTAQGRQADQGQFRRGLEALEEGDVEAAHFAFQGLAKQSIYRQREEVKQAELAFARASLQEGRTLLQQDPQQAKRRAERVLRMEGLAESLVDEAESLQEAADERLSRIASAPPPGRRARTRAPVRAAEQVDERPSQPTATRSNSTWSEVAGCAAAGDHRCVVDALEGQAGSARELALLIETYRQMGNRSAQLRNMSEYVRRYPTSAKAQNYRQILSRYGY